MSARLLMFVPLTLLAAMASSQPIARGANTAFRIVLFRQRVSRAEGDELANAVLDVLRIDLAHDAVDSWVRQAASCWAWF